VLKPCQSQVPDQGWGCWITLSTFAQKYIEHFRKISVTSKKYRNIPKRMSGVAKKCGIFSGLLQLPAQVRGARCPTPRVRHGAGVQGVSAIKSSLHPSLSVYRFRQRQGHALSGSLRPP
jgi:hypothetical protein